MSETSETMPQSSDARERSVRVLFEGVGSVIGPAPLPERISELRLDSRACNPGDVFFAVKGSQTDGIIYAREAVRRGATIVVSEGPWTACPPTVANVVVSSVPSAMSIVAKRFFLDPSSKLALIGVTGTNGKTTIATLLCDALTSLGAKVGLLSTIENRIGDRRLESRRTTEDALTLNTMLLEMVACGCTHACIEVSSHALVQGRVDGLNFRAAIYTNLTRDHLDYHPSMLDYRDAKKLLFDRLSPEACAIVNADDRNAEVMIQNTAARIRRYSIKGIADYTAKILAQHLGNMDLQIEGVQVGVALMGEFNASNLIAIYSTLRELGYEAEEALKALSLLQPATGRLDFQVGPDVQIVVVDYAHTPDALKNVLRTLGDVKPKESQLITLFGCGGDRDHGKRPEMGKIASEMSDWVFITNDNPRSEDPASIANDILAGVPGEVRSRVFVELDRATAIRKAILLARSYDYVLVAGKGHETYQEQDGVKVHFDDREQVATVIGELRDEQLARVNNENKGERN